MANLLKMAMIDTIVRLHRQGWSNRRIARELGIDRDAVSRHIRQLRANPKAAKAPPGSDAEAESSRAAKAPPGSEDGADGSKAAKAPLGSEAMLSPGQRSLCAPWRAVIVATLE